MAIKINEPESETSELLSKIWAEIEGYDTSARSFVKEGDRITDLYVNRMLIDSGAPDAQNKFDVVWSITQTLQPILFSQMPEPYVERRFKDKDPQGRRASMLLERCIKAVLSLQDTVGTFRQSRDDFLLPGRGQVWCRYAPTFEKVPQLDDLGQPLLDKKGEIILKEQLKYENVEIEYVPWKDFGYSAAKVWSGVKSVWRHLYLTKEDAIKQLGKDEARKLKYTLTGSTDPKRSKEESSGLHKRAKITEFWDFDSKKIYTISESNKDTIIKETSDKLKLSRFFPCPKPLFATKKTDTLIPVADYTILKSLVVELDIVTLREAMMVDAMKASGVSSAQVANGLKAVFESDDNIIQPIKEWIALKSQGGTQGGAIEWLPLEMFAKVLEQLRARKEELKQDIYELIGLSDIQRGVTNPYESGRAIEAKAQASSERVKERQRFIQEFIKDTVNIVAEIISEHFADETIYLMAGVEFLGQEYVENFLSDVALLRDDVTRNFRIDVTIDSLSDAEEEKEKANVNEFINAMAQIMGQSQAVLQVMPELKPVMLEALKFAVRRYKAGRSLEGLLDSTIDQALMDEEARKNEPPQEDPQLAIDRMKVEVEQFKVQSKTELDAQKAQHKAEIDNAKTQNEIAISQANVQIEQAKLQEDQARFQLDQQQAEAKNQLDAAIMQAKAQETALKEKIAQADMQVQMSKLELQQAESKAQNEIAMLTLKAEAKQAQLELMLHSRTEADKLVVQERTAHLQTKQTAQADVAKATKGKESSDGASVATAIAAALKSIPQPIVNVEAPKPTTRKGTMKKNKKGETEIVVTESEQEESEDTDD